MRRHDGAVRFRCSDVVDGSEIDRNRSRRGHDRRRHVAVHQIPRQPIDRRRDAHRGDDVAVMVPDRRGQTPHPFFPLLIVNPVTAFADDAARTAYETARAAGFWAADQAIPFTGEPETVSSSGLDSRLNSNGVVCYPEK